MGNVLGQAGFKGRAIEFMWSGALHKGVIVKQDKGGIMGLRTEIKVSDPVNMEFVIYGKCDLGPCGPYTVTKIDKP